MSSELDLTTCCCLLRNGYITDQSVLFSLGNALIGHHDKTCAIRPVALAIDRHLSSVQKDKEEAHLIYDTSSNSVERGCDEQIGEEDKGENNSEIKEIIPSSFVSLLSAALEVMNTDNYDELFELIVRFSEDHWGITSNGKQRVHQPYLYNDYSGTGVTNSITALEHGLLQGVSADAAVFRQLLFKYRVPTAYVSTLTGSRRPLKDLDRIIEDEIDTEAYGFSYVPSSEFVTAVIADGLGVKAWLQVMRRFLELSQEGSQWGLSTTAPFTLTVYRRDREQRVAHTNSFLEDDEDVSSLLPRKPLFDPVQVSCVWGRHAKCDIKRVRSYCQQLAGRTMAQKKADEGTLGESNLLGAIILRHTKNSNIMVLQTMSDDDIKCKEDNIISGHEFGESLFPSWGQLVIQCRNAWQVHRPYFRYINSESRVSQGLYDTITITENANYMCWKKNCSRRKGYCPELFVYEHCPISEIYRFPNPVPIKLSTMLARAAVEGNYPSSSDIVSEVKTAVPSQRDSKGIDQIIQNLNDSKKTPVSPCSIFPKRQNGDVSDLVLYHKKKLQALLNEEEQMCVTNRDEMKGKSKESISILSTVGDYRHASINGGKDCNSYIQQVYVTNEVNVSNKLSCHDALPVSPYRIITTSGDEHGVTDIVTATGSTIRLRYPYGPTFTPHHLNMTDDNRRINERDVESLTRGERHLQKLARHK